MENDSRELMPVVLGCRTYHQIHDAPRDECKVDVATRQQVVLSEALIPTGAAARHLA